MHSLATTQTQGFHYTPETGMCVEHQSPRQAAKEQMKLDHNTLTPTRMPRLNKKFVLRCTVTWGLYSFSHLQLQHLAQQHPPSKNEETLKSSQDGVWLPLWLGERKTSTHAIISPYGQAAPVPGWDGNAWGSSGH